MGICHPQPSGELCKDCHETIRRGWPGKPRSEVVAKLADSAFRDEEFAEARATYQQDMRDKIRFGSSKIKKRAKAVKKVEKTKVKQKVSGKMMRLPKYRGRALNGCEY